jgi:transposase-like protein
VTKRIVRDPIYQRRRFSPETIELCVRWYITYRLSYRDLVAMMAERGIVVSHTTIMRWVLRYVPEYETRWARFTRSPDSSWRMDETAVNVRGGRYYLYRAVDRHGKSVASSLCNDRSMEAAQTFFRESVARPGVLWPRKINLDGNSATRRALRLLAEEDARWRTAEIRSSRYLNNVVEQDHRAIKRRCASMLHFKSYRSAAVTLAGIELAHRIRKGQYSLQSQHDEGSSSLKELWNAALKQDETPPTGSGSSPPMHRISTMRRHRHEIDQERSLLEPVRYPRKVFFGGSLYMLLMPKGGRYWRYSYRYRGKEKTLSLGTYPDVPFLRARARHEAARRLLAVGLDPSLSRKDLRSEGLKILLSDVGESRRWAFRSRATSSSS